MKWKGITCLWLAQADLSNLNSGQGSGNLTELKTYDFGRKPYVSGQAVRFALFDTIHRLVPDAGKCLPEAPCGDVANCWDCDLRGYLNPKEGQGSDRRWSPLKVTPALGQIPAEITTDLLLRMSYIPKKDKEEVLDTRLANVQMTENIYRLALSMDLANIGRVIEPVFEEKRGATGNKKNYQLKEWKTVLEIPMDEKITRIKTVLDAVFNLSGFAKQARAAASLAPDLVVILLQTVYNQRGLKALSLDEKGHLNRDLFEGMVVENKALGNSVFIGYNKGLLQNEEVLFEVSQAHNLEVYPVYKAFEEAKAAIE
jgi:CRISPR-associated protein Cst2